MRARVFSAKTEDVEQNNLAVAKEGFNLGAGLVNSSKIKIDIRNDVKVKDQILLSGTEAVALGAIAGGCNFISSYPMSPSTGVLAFLAKQAKDFSIIAEQAEDEIDVMNTTIGACFAGARTMITTSGGGFALMAEDLSLAGILVSLPIMNGLTLTGHFVQTAVVAVGFFTHASLGRRCNLDDCQA